MDEPNLMTAKSTRVPAALQDKFNAIAQAADAFCDQRLNGEYQHLIRLALAALSRKRPSPLLKGKDAAWAAGAVHALDMGQLSVEWMLPGRMDTNPLIWMLEVNGLMVDVRHMPLEVQEIAFAKGFIPHVPGRKEGGA